MACVSILFVGIVYRYRCIGHVCSSNYYVFKYPDFETLTKELFKLTDESKLGQEVARFTSDDLTDSSSNALVRIFIYVYMCMYIN